MRLIDADKLYNKIWRWKGRNIQEEMLISKFLDNIIIEPAYKGEWILNEFDNSVSCLHCGCTLYSNDIL